MNKCIRISRSMTKEIFRRRIRGGKEGEEEENAWISCYGI